MHVIEQQNDHLPIINRQEQAPSNRRNFFKRLLQLGGLSGVALFSMRAGSVSAADQKKTLHLVNARDFGAAGNGVVDDTDAIQAAINASNLVYLPAGIYKCTSALMISKSNFKMYGDGELHFEKDFNGGGVTISAHVSNICLDGLIIRLMSNVNGLSFCGVYSIPSTASVVSSRFTNLKIYGAAFGINIDGGKKVATIPSEVANKAFSLAPGKATPMESALDGRITLSGNVIKDSLFSVRIGSGGAHGIYVRGSGYNIITSNHIENMQGGILAASEGIISNNIIINCFEDNGIYCAGSTGLSVIGNFIENTKADGIAFNHSVNCSAIGNQVSGARNASFRIQTGHNIVLSGNICNSKGVSSSLVRVFIDSESPDAPYNILIENNLFTGGITRRNPFAFGSVPLGSAYKNWRITGNQTDSVDISKLTGAFFGPYAIVMFGSHEGNSNLIVEGNTFTGVTPCPQASVECRFIRNATQDADNVFEYTER